MWHPLYDLLTLSTTLGLIVHTILSWFLELSTILTYFTFTVSSPYPLPYYHIHDTSVNRGPSSLLLDYLHHFYYYGKLQILVCKSPLAILNVSPYVVHFAFPFKDVYENWLLLLLVLYWFWWFLFSIASRLTSSTAIHDTEVVLYCWRCIGGLFSLLESSSLSYS